MIDGTILIESASGAREVELSDYLTGADEEAAHDSEYDWIKKLRHARVGGDTFRERFTVRGDSLWWFSEVYLHKQQAILDIHRSIAAAQALIDRERPLSLRVVRGSAVVRDVVPQVAALMKVRSGSSRVSRLEWAQRMARLRWRAWMLMSAAGASRMKRSAGTAPTRAAIAAFVHRAFWRKDVGDGSAESYIGPVLKALEDRSGPQDVQYVGVGPEENFRTRRWWRPRPPREPDAVVPVEHYAPAEALAASKEIWRARRKLYAALIGSDDLRGAASFDGIDAWPIVREQLAGIVWLQWPWSAKAMDEAAAALDIIRPRIVVTYAEAGGWGRALVLEARRRGIPSIGLQHGFIYRHWLNYLHEPDELQPQGADRGFPLPTATLTFDDYAGSHLRSRGGFPEAAVRVTGSPKLDSLIESLRAVTPADLASVRRAARVDAGATLVLVTTKERQARHVLPALVDAAAGLPDVTIVIKPHPAESADAYDGIAAGRPHVRVVPPATSLTLLLAASRAVVTINSTVAIDAAVAGIPSLVIGLPNNLSPLVDAGALAGARTTAEIGPQLQRILYDEGFRQQLDRARRAFVERYRIRADGRAAARSAEAVLELGKQGS